MAWGGARSGAGAPRGGISAARLQLDEAFKLGFSHALVTKHAHLATGDKAKDSVMAAAMVVSDMVQAGEGSKALQIWAQIAPKSDQGSGEGGGGSDLELAINRLSKNNNVPNESLKTVKPDNTPINSATCDDRAMDGESNALENGPFFNQQLPLMMGSSPSDHTAQPPPGPPSAPTPTTLSLDGENFEKNRNSDFDNV